MEQSQSYMIQAEGLSKRFGERLAVDDVSFAIEKGEIMGFLGPNAAGKTTTMKMLTCFYPPTEGTAKVNGCDILEDSFGVRRSIGYMPENVPLYMDMTVEEFLNFVARAKAMAHLDIPRAINKTLERCSLEGVRDQLIRTISRGYKQRVGLAQAIMNEPPVLILDEPTVGLDPEQIKNFRELIKSLGSKSTIILSTHILSEVSLTCNRVCIIDHGQIIAVDDTDNLEHQTNVRLEIFAPNPERFIEAAAQLKEVGPVECEGQSQLPESEHPLLKFVVRDIRDRVGAHRALFSLAVAQGWEIYSLHDERVTLEDAFIRLINKHQEMGGKK